MIEEWVALITHNEPDRVAFFIVAIAAVSLVFVVMTFARMMNRTNKSFTDTQTNLNVTQKQMIELQGTVIKLQASDVDNAKKINELLLSGREKDVSLSEQNRRIVELEAYRKEDQKSIAQLRKDRDDAQKQVNTFIEKQQTDASRINELTNRLNDLESQHTKDTEEMTKLNQRIDELNAERDEALKERDSTAHALAEALSKIDMLQSRIDELERKSDTGDLPKASGL